MSGTESSVKKKLRQEDLFTQVQYLKGVGPDRALLLNKLGIHTVVDLLFLFPRKYDDFTTLTTPGNIVTGENTTLFAKVVDFESNYTRTGKCIVTALVQVIDPDGTTLSGEICVQTTWFNLEYLARKLERDQTIVLQGVIKQDEDRYIMSQPKISWMKFEDLPQKARLLPVYPLTDGVSQDKLRKITRNACDEYSHLLDDVFPESFLAEHGLLGIHAAVRQTHMPDSQTEIDDARRRLIFQELFIQQTALAMRRKYLESQQSAPK